MMDIHRGKNIFWPVTYEKHLFIEVMCEIWECIEYLLSVLLNYWFAHKIPYFCHFSGIWVSSRWLTHQHTVALIHSLVTGWEQGTTGTILRVSLLDGAWTYTTIQRWVMILHTVVDQLWCMWNMQTMNIPGMPYSPSKEPFFLWGGGGGGGVQWCPQNCQHS